MQYQFNKPTLAIVCALFSGVAAHAADWSDTSIGYRTGSSYREPVNPEDISKNIVNLTHISGYKYGTNFFNVDLLMSDSKDPAGFGSTDGAQEVYVVYRHTLDLEKVTGTSFKYGPIRDMGLVAGFDFNTKTDAGYNSKKRMLVLGPVAMMDVPGVLNIGVQWLWESNAPYNTFPGGGATPRYDYTVHPMLNVVWDIPLGKTAFSFEGFGAYIVAKGKDEFGGDTAPETNIDMELMYDASGAMGIKPHTFKLGLEYQYWNNKFGDDNSNPFYQGGAKASTPMFRMEYHF